MQMSYDDLPALVSRMTGDEKHGSAANSTLDVLWVLYDRVLRVTPDTTDDPDRDRFVLSKGHGPASYFAVLAAKGFVDVEDLDRFDSWNGPLGLHPDRHRVRGVEVSSGSLGHGLPIAVGIALALGLRGRRRPRVMCLMGDAECGEGSVWEAAQFAGRQRLEQLTAIVVDNHTDTLGWPGGLGARFALEGWRAHAVDGRSHRQLELTLSQPNNGQPSIVVADISGGVRR